MNNFVLETVLNEALSELSDNVTPETSKEVIRILDTIENHTLLKDNNSFTVSKMKGRIVILACKNTEMTFKVKPMVVDVQNILNSLRKLAKDKEENLKLD